MTASDETAAPVTDIETAAALPRWWRVGGAVRQDVRTVVAVHERFARETATMLSRVARCEADVLAVDSEWMSFGEYLSCVGDCVALGHVDLPGAPTGMLVGLECGIGLRVLDRLLGGSGAAIPGRAPTELEQDLLADVLTGPVSAVGDVFGSALRAAPQLTQLTTQPTLLRFVPLTEAALVMTYRIGLELPVAADGLLTLCYPAAAVGTLLGAVGQSADASSAPAPPPGASVLRALIEDVEMDLVARLQPSSVAAEDLRRLRVGDVLILDHHRDHAIDLAVGDVVVCDGALGRRGRAVAVAVQRRRVAPKHLIGELS